MSLVHNDLIQAISIFRPSTISELSLGKNRVQNAKRYNDIIVGATRDLCLHCSYQALFHLHRHPSGLLWPDVEHPQRMSTECKASGWLLVAQHALGWLCPWCQSSDSLGPLTRQSTCCPLERGRGLPAVIGDNTSFNSLRPQQHGWLGVTWPGHIGTVYSRYIAVGGFQAMVLWYKCERDISGVCHEPKSGSIFQRVVSDNGAFVCLAANSARNHWIWWHLSKFDIALQNHVVEFPYQSRLINLKPCVFAEITVLPAISFSPKIKVATRKTAIYSTVRVHFRKFRWQSNGFCIKSVSIESLEPDVAVISRICGHILNRFALWLQPYFGVHIPLEEPQNIYQSHALDLLRNYLSVCTRWWM